MKTYDANGFDNDWIHVVTGTRYDEYGFNKDGSIHEVTRLPVDNKGHRRDYYETAVLSPEEKNQDLFFKHCNLELIKKIKNDLYQKNERVSKIILSNYKIEKKSIYTGPTCMDGTPDMRYNGGCTTASKTHIELTIKEKNFNQKLYLNYLLDQNYSKEIIETTIDSYNEYLYFMKDEKLSKLYKVWTEISSYSTDNKNRHNDLLSIKREKLDVYEKLKQYKNNFNSEQLVKFNILKSKIKSIEQEISSINLYEQECDDLYKKIEIRKNELKQKLDKNKIDDEINMLLNDL